MRWPWRLSWMALGAFVQVGLDLALSGEVSRALRFAGLLVVVIPAMYILEHKAEKEEGE